MSVNLELVGGCMSRLILERLVAQQLVEYLRTGDLPPDCQSAYRPLFSTATAVLRVPSCIDEGDIAALVLFDLSAAFDKVNHEFCCFVCIRHSVLFAPFSTGFGPTSWAELDRFAVNGHRQPIYLRSV
jgi:hypothetical protein